MTNTIIKWMMVFGSKIVKCVVFICYSSQNLKEAKETRKLVKKYGGIPFMAPYSIEVGNNPKEVIFSNIYNCDIFLPLIDSKTTKSTFVHQEIGYALSSKKTIIPITIGKIKQEDLGFLYDLHHEKYNTKKFKKSLKNKILKKYASTILFYVVLLIVLLWIKLKPK